MNERGKGKTSQQDESLAASSLRSRLASFAILAAAAILGTAPLHARMGFSCGHDFDFHLSSWFDALHSWRQGIFYPHWAASANYGAGEPRFVFYPPLTWMLGAALGAVFDWQKVPLVLTCLVLFAIGMAVRALAREVLTEAPATLAGCFALFSAYTLFTVYERSDYAELTGGVWLPLLLLFALRDLRSPQQSRRVLNGTIAPLAIVLAGAWLSNPTVGVMASYLLAAMAITVAVMQRSWIPAARAAIAAALGLALSAFYWLPAWWQQRWVAIGQAISDPGEQIQNSFLFGRHANPALQLHDIELRKVSAIVVFMVALSGLALLTAWRRRTVAGPRRWWMPMAAIPFAVLLLQLPISLPLWNALPQLRFLQFPWRWLVAVEAPMALLLAAAVWPRSGRARVWAVAGCSAFFVASAAFAGVVCHQNCDPEDAIPGMWASYIHHIGFEGTDEYAPPAADNSTVATSLPDACLVADPSRELGGGDPDLTPEWSPEQGSCVATYNFAERGGDPEHLRLAADIPHDGYLVLRLRRYPAWSVRVNGRAAGEFKQREDGLMAIAVPSGAVAIAIDWSTTRDVTASRWISGMGFLLLLGVIALERRPSQFS